MTETQKEVLGALVTGALLIGAAAGWWMFYIHPRDQFLGQVMTCMADGSQAEYDRCAELVRANKS